MDCVFIGPVRTAVGGFWTRNPVPRTRKSVESGGLGGIDFFPRRTPRIGVKVGGSVLPAF